MEIWILGAGRFGSLAVERLTHKHPRARITVVESECRALRVFNGPVKTVVGDGVLYLARHLDRGGHPDWIVPAMPLHVAFEWIRRTLSPPHGVEGLPVPEEVALLVPHPLLGKDGEMYTSHADFLCPDNCPEPPDRCTMTGMPRKGDLFRLLEGLRVPGHRSVVVRSHQLAPGVGGYPPLCLVEARAAVLEAEGRILLSTSCRCHAVMHALRLTRHDQ